MNRRALADLARPHVLGNARGWWSVIVPEGTTNLVANPSIEVATTGWTGNVGGETLARSTARSTRGVASLAFTPVANAISSARYDVTLAANTMYTLSVDVYGAVGVPLALTLFDNTAVVPLAFTRFTGANRWQHIVLIARTGANTAHSILVGKYNGSPASASLATFYLDGVQVEAKAYETTYIDGDQVGGSWLGTPHASASTRFAATRTGGRIVPLTDYQYRVTSIIGAHSGTYANIAIPNAQVGGALYQDSIPQPRQFSVVGRFEAQSLASLHRCQQALLDAVKPDRYKQPVRLLYQPFDCQDELGRAILIDAVYSSGLEGALVDEANEDAAITFTTYAPAAIGKTTVDSALDLAAVLAVANANYIVRRESNGTWMAMGTGGDATVLAMAVGPDNCIYVGGSFTLMNGVANTAHIAKWNPDTATWTALGTGADNDVYALAFGADGILYAGGAFHNIGGVACAHIAMWNGTIWAPMAAGANDVVLSIIVNGPKGGLVQAGGIFTLMDGVANTVYIASWDGATWTALGTGASSWVYALTVGLDGMLYAGGQFLLMGGVVGTQYIAQWDGTVWTPLSSGAGGFVYALCVGPGGSVYAGGAFVTLGTVGCAHIGRWNGSQWYPLGSGVNGDVRALFIEPGALHVGGLFTVAGGITLPSTYAVWNGSAWLLGDIDLPGAAQIYAICVHQSRLYLGYNTAGAATASGGVISVNNTGTLDTYPEIRLTGPGMLTTIQNFTTGDKLFFNLTLLAGEHAILRLGPRLELVKIAELDKPFFYSSFRDNLIPTILPGSNPATWKLTPGANSVSLYWSGTTAASTAAVIFRPSFDSIAGAVLP